MVPLASTLPHAAELQTSTYFGWNTYRLSNGMATVQVAPMLGGRTIQCSLGNHDFLWANRDLAGQSPPASGLGPGGTFINWGGDKLWPAPQGWDGPDQWPGPPDAVLDGSPHQATVLAERGSAVSVRLVSGNAPDTGIRFSRTITLPAGSARVLSHAVMTNVDSKPRRWGIWSITQLDVSSPSGEGYDPDFYGYIPINPHSHFPAGYSVLFGDAHNPQFVPHPQQHLLRIHYERKVGKAALDSDAGWVANVDGARGYVFVQAFQFKPDREYPDEASVEYWVYGLGSIFAWHKLIEMPESAAENPYSIETELLGPLETLQPGQSASFDYEWRLARIGGNFPIIDCTDAGCTAEVLSASQTSGGTLTLSGRFGVFYHGSARLRFLDERGKQLFETHPVSVSPDSPLVMRSAFHDLAVPAGACSLEVLVSDDQGKSVGTLARCAMP